MQNVCKHCRFSAFMGRYEGECRRYPPITIWAPDTTTLVSAWPKVGPEDWCGEFKAHASVDTT